MTKWTPRIGAMGGSQGGALAIVGAALAPEIKRVVSRYPFLSEYQRMWELEMAITLRDTICPSLLVKDAVIFPDHGHERYLPGFADRAFTFCLAVLVRSPGRQTSAAQ